MLHEEDLRDDVTAEVQRMLREWPKPAAVWPEGATVVERDNDFFDRPANESRHGRAQLGPHVSLYHHVTLPSGGELIVLTQPDRPSSVTGESDADAPWAYGKAPHVVYSLLVDEVTGAVFAAPRVCNMTIRHTKRREDFGKSEWILREVGLETRYRIGQLQRPLGEVTHVESDGWGFK